MAIKKLTPTAAEETLTQETPTNSTALALFGTSSLFQIEEPKQQSDLFPQVKIPYPIEMGDPIKPEHIFRVCLFDGKVVAKLSVPYIITAIAAREATREEIKDAQGKTKYNRFFIGGKSGQAHIDAREKAKAKVPGYHLGDSYIVGIITPEGVTVAELPAFKVAKDYWGQALKQARATQGWGVQIMVEDHSPNLVAGQSGLKYLSPKKFIQYKPVELTQDQLTALEAVFLAVKGKYDIWRGQ